MAAAARSGVSLVGVAAVTVAFLAWVAAAPSVRADGSVTYTYDGLGRLVVAVYDSGLTITYSYDANGNVTQQVITVQ